MINGINIADVFGAHYALVERANELTYKHTAFRDFESMLTAKGGYRPTLRRSNPETRTLAALYDGAQAARRDDRRAFMAGKPTRAGTIIDPDLYDRAENWYRHGDTRTFWDKYTRHWISYTVDSAGNQVGSSDMYPNADSLLRTLYG